MLHCKIPNENDLIHVQKGITFIPHNGEEHVLCEGQNSIIGHVPRFTECLEWRTSLTVKCPSVL